MAVRGLPRHDTPPALPGPRTALRRPGWRSRLLLALLALALAPVPGRCSWRTFTTSDGLAALKVSAIVEDRSGTFWFATEFGLTRSNGVAWSTLRAGAELPGSDVTSILEDRAGNLWFGTRSGLARFDGTSWRTFRAPGELTSDDVRCLFQDHHGNVWVGTSFGACRYDGTSWTRFVPDADRPVELVTAIAEDGDLLWFGTEGRGAWSFDGSIWQRLSTAALPSDYVQSLFVDRAGDLWIGTELGVAHRRGSIWRTYIQAGPFGLRNVRAMRNDPQGNLWLGSESCLARFDGLSWHPYTSADGLAHGAVWALLFDGSGNLWAAAEDGLSRYDRVSWSTVQDATLETYGVKTIFEDSAGALWFGAPGGGAGRYDGTTVTWFGAGNGFPSNRVNDIVQDPSGALWFATHRGIARLDGSGWRVFTTADGLVNDTVQVALVDRRGRLWLGTNHGACRYDTTSWKPFAKNEGLTDAVVRSLWADAQGRIVFGSDAGVSFLDETSVDPWTHYTVANSGLADNAVFAILQGRGGRFWFGTHEGLNSFDGTEWRVFAPSEGLASNLVNALLEDREGVLWVGTDRGLSRFDGSEWHSYVTELPSPMVRASLEGRSGDLWFGTTAGAVRHEPDRVPPHAVLWPLPPELSGNTIYTFTYSPAFRDDGVEFSTSLDEAMWSPWTHDGFTIAQALTDGVHELRVRARDELALTDSTTLWRFTVDAAPPAPRLAYPVFGQAVRDSVTIRGTADDPRFLSYRVEVRPEGASSWDSTVATALGEGFERVVDGVLAGWNTAGYAEGSYELRVAEFDVLGLTGATTVAVIVDNAPPWSDQTTPAKVSAAMGGDVYTTGADAHLYFPPHAVSEDAVVTLEARDASALPTPLPTGAHPLHGGFDMSWSVGRLLKPVSFDLAVPVGGSPTAGVALWRYDPVGGWVRHGGTPTSDGTRVSAPITQAGHYALFAGGPETPGQAEVSAMSLAPRVFSPSGAFARATIEIGFTLGRAGNVSVRVYNRGGRLVRQLADGMPMGPGANLVRWDGTDRDGRPAVSGLYLVTLEAFGLKRTSTLVVIR